MKVKFNDIKDVLPDIWKCYTTKEISEYFDICENTVWRWVSSLKLPSKKVGRRPLSINFDGELAFEEGDTIICLHEGITKGKVMYFADDEVIIETKQGRKQLPLKNCRKLI